jgi:hypothetical protein
MNASRFVLERITERREATNDPDLLGWLDVIVRTELQRRSRDVK